MTQLNPCAQQQHLRTRAQLLGSRRAPRLKHWTLHNTAPHCRQPDGSAVRPSRRCSLVGDIKQLLRGRRRASRVVLAWPGLGCGPADPQLTRLLLLRASPCLPAGPVQPGRVVDSGFLVLPAARHFGPFDFPPNVILISMHDLPPATRHVLPQNPSRRRKEACCQLTDGTRPHPLPPLHQPRTILRPSAVST